MSKSFPIFKWYSFQISSKRIFFLKYNLCGEKATCYRYVSTHLSTSNLGWPRLVNCTIILSMRHLNQRVPAMSHWICNLITGLPISSIDCDIILILYKLSSYSIFTSFFYLYVFRREKRSSILNCLFNFPSPKNISSFDCNHYNPVLPFQTPIFIFISWTFLSIVK